MEVRVPLMSCSQSSIHLPSRSLGSHLAGHHTRAKKHRGLLALEFWRRLSARNIRCLGIHLAVVLPHILYGPPSLKSVLLYFSFIHWKTTLILLQVDLLQIEC